jgi:hypothetical protein
MSIRARMSLLALACAAVGPMAIGTVARAQSLNGDPRNDGVLSHALPSADPNILADPRTVKYAGVRSFAPPPVASPPVTTADSAPASTPATGPEPATASAPAEGSGTAPDAPAETPATVPDASTEVAAPTPDTPAPDGQPASEPALLQE